MRQNTKRISVDDYLQLLGNTPKKVEDNFLIEGNVILPKTERKTAKKKAVKKSESIVALENMYTTWMLSQGKSTSGISFEDKTANGMTKAIMAYFDIIDGFAARINSTGVYRADIGKFTYGGGTNGMADISALHNGMAIQIEVKAGNDKPRESQLKIKRKYEKCGGYYIFVHSFKEFLDKFNEIIERNDRSNM